MKKALIFFLFLIGINTYGQDFTSGVQYSSANTGFFVNVGLLTPLTDGYTKILLHTGVSLGIEEGYTPGPYKSTKISNYIKSEMAGQTLKSYSLSDFDIGLTYSFELGGMIDFADSEFAIGGGVKISRYTSATANYRVNSQTKGFALITNHAQTISYELTDEGSWALSPMFTFAYHGFFMSYSPQTWDELETINHTFCIGMRIQD
ncbi:MAG: hypothetical protein N4A45_01480 [Flavobacteriales bacterium]|jgi:hypothetical protein|nr:hypothetical protein [Flavobacteriales bacterium]